MLLFHYRLDARVSCTLTSVALCNLHLVLVSTWITFQCNFCTDFAFTLFNIAGWVSDPSSAIHVSPSFAPK